MFNGISTPYRLFNAKISFIYKCFIAMSNYIFNVPLHFSSNWIFKKWSTVFSLHKVIRYQVFLYNTNNLNTVIWFQVFLSNTNNLHTVVWFQVFLSNTNNLYTVVWFQVFLSNTNNLYTVVWFQVFLSNTNNLYTVVWFQVFLSNTNNLYTVVWFQVFLSNTNTYHTVIWFKVTLDFKKVIWVKARWELHKDTACCIKKNRIQHLTKQQLYSHLPPISQTIQWR